jgi:FtsP/CotA-like multicopper oxidase with cupredoxin domain
MRILTSVMAVSMLVLVGSARAGTCPGSNVIVDPTEFQWTDTDCPAGYNCGTLEIGEASFTINGDTLTTRAYRQDPLKSPDCQADPECGIFSIPGPTIRMTPGEKYVLSFKNTLPFEVPSPVHNDLKDPNITNIHTHGLHVSGESPADDITRLINGGFCGDYVYEVPDDHMGGTLWYHAHHHGSTYLQVAGGAFGLLIVDDTNDECLPGETPGIDKCVPVNVAGMTERLLAIGFLDPDVAGAGGDILVSGTLQPTWTVNGKVGGSLCMPANEWQHFRVLLADRDARLKTLSVETPVGAACEVALLARDGVWRTVAPKPLTDNSIELTGASRADLAVKCTADSTIEVNGQPVANVVVGGTGDTTVGPWSEGPTGITWEAERPSYLRDLRSITVPINTESISMGARTVNGEKFDADVATFAINADAIQEWTIRGARQHPFHLHVYHVQMQGACGAFEDGEYYDTVAGNCLVRFDTNPATASVYDGRTIMHCHILLHEDEGAMGWADVVGGAPPPGLPAGKQALYECGEDCVITEDPELTTCFDGLDNDCDGLTDCADDSCDTAVNGTCDTGDPGICGPGTFQCQGGAETCVADTPAGTEGPSGDLTCSDGLDNDCDGLTDGNDPDCFDGGCVPTHNNEKGPRCSDTIDNDCDGLIDGADPDC